MRDPRLLADADQACARFEDALLGLVEASRLALAEDDRTVVFSATVLGLMAGFDPAVGPGSLAGMLAAAVTRLAERDGGAS